MNFQVLPYIFKRIGLLLFIGGPVGQFMLGVMDPFQEDGISGFPDWYSKMLSIASLLGIVLYFISKEKVEDELIKKIRLESMSLAFLWSVVTLLIISIIDYSVNSNVNAPLMFYLQLTLFLIIYHYKKRNFSL